MSLQRQLELFTRLESNNLIHPEAKAKLERLQRQQKRQERQEIEANQRRAETEMSVYTNDSLPPKKEVTEIIPTFALTRPDNICFTSMQQIEIMHERTNDRMLVILVESLKDPDTNERLNSQLTQLQKQMPFLLMGRTSVNCTEIVSQFNIS